MYAPTHLGKATWYHFLVLVLNVHFLRRSSLILQTQLVQNLLDCDYDSQEKSTYEDHPQLKVASPAMKELKGRSIGRQNEKMIKVVTGLHVVLLTSRIQASWSDPHNTKSLGWDKCDILGKPLQSLQCLKEFSLEEKNCG